MAPVGTKIFQPFGVDHAAVLILVVAAALALVFGARGIRRIHDDRAIRYGAATTLGLLGASAWVHNHLAGLIVFPFHLCDVALVATIWALIRPEHRLVGELAFFWALAGSVQAVLTPDLAHGFPSVRWISFFVLHGGVVLSAVYLMARGCLVLRPASIARAWLATNVYAAVAGFLNWQFGVNFGFLAQKPTNPSLLDYLGPWPYYIIVCEGIALALFAVCYGFARVVESWAQRWDGSNEMSRQP
jgi:hypothetical integral membrane protein (TIGR02206 family)